MKRTRSVSIALCLLAVVMLSLAAEGCNLGRKACGCGMDLNGSMPRRHGLFRR